jgi:DHA3 family tetracycline resistance protein-like MFS transporter
LVNILLIGFFYGLYSEGFDRLWTQHMLTSFSLPAWLGANAINVSGLVWVGSALLGIAAVEYLHRRLNLQRIRHLAGVMFAATALLCAALLTLAWLGDYFWLMVVTLWVISVARQVIGPLYTAWVNQKIDPQVRATVISMSSQVDAIGQIAGGPAVGLVGRLVSVRAALTASGLLLGPVFLLLGKARWEERP